MSEITIKAPHPGSTLKELVEACDSLIHIDKQFDEALLGEVLAAMMPDTEVPAGWKSSPYPESENDQIWCAAQFAMHCRGDFEGAMRMLDQLGPRRPLPLCKHHGSGCGGHEGEGSLMQKGLGEYWHI